MPERDEADREIPRGAPPGPEDAVPPPSGAPDPPSPAPAEAATPARPPRRSVFSLEGRAAPGLYAIGWFLTIAGITILLVLLAAGTQASTIASIVALTAFAALAAGTLAGAGAQALQRRADGWLAYWGPSPWLVLVSLFATMVLVQVLVDRILRVFGVDSGTPAGTLFVLLAYLPMYAGIVHLVVVAPGALTWAEIRRPRSFGRTVAPIAPDLGPYADGRERRRDDLLGDVLWGVTMLAITIPATILALALATLVLGNPPVSSPLPETHTAPGLLLNLVTAAVLAPIGEELFFRGFATNAWARTLPLRRAIAQAALVFAFVHILGQSGSDAGTAFRAAGIAFVGRIPVAIALSWIYLRRGSLYASMAHHAGYNAFLTLVAWSVTAG